MMRTKLNIKEYTHTASGNASRTAISPNAFVCDHLDFDSKSADNDDTWINVSTPTSAHIFAIVCGMVTCTSSKS